MATLPLVTHELALLIVLRGIAKVRSPRLLTAPVTQEVADQI